MPDLPTITIANQAVFDRVVAAFGDAPTYRQWLREQIKAYVQQSEAYATLMAKAAEIDNLNL